METKQKVEVLISKIAVRQSSRVREQHNKRAAFISVKDLISILITEWMPIVRTIRKSRFKKKKCWRANKVVLLGVSSSTVKKKKRKITLYSCRGFFIPPPG